MKINLVILLFLSSIRLFAGREIEYVDLSKVENEGFFRYGHKLISYVMKGVEENRIQPLKFTVNYKSYKALNQEEYLNQIELGYEGDNWLAFPDDFTLIAFDKIKRKKEFVHLFLTENKRKEYRFSISYVELVNYLIENGDDLIAYYTTNERCQWRGEVLISGGGFFIDELSLNDLCSDKETYGADFLLFEHKEGDGVRLDSIGVNAYNASYDYDTTPTIFSKQEFWKDFKNGELSTMWEALNNEKYTIDSIKGISKLKGKLLKGELNEKVIDNRRRCYNVVYDRMLLTDNGNEILSEGGKSFVELMWEYLKNNDIPKFRNDSLKTKLVDVFSNMIKPYFPQSTSKKWGVDSVYVGDTITFENRSYVVTRDARYPKTQSDFTYVDEEDWWPVERDEDNKNGVDTSFYREIPNRFYNPKDIFFFEVFYKQTFNKTGKEREYHVEGVSVFIPAEINYKGIDIPVASLKWSDIRPYLLKDERALDEEGSNYSFCIESRIGYHRMIRAGGVFFDD